MARSHGHRASPYDTATVVVRPTPHAVAGSLPAADLRAVSEWIRLNESVIVDYWEGTIGTGELMRQLRPISPPIPP